MKTTVACKDVSRWFGLVVAVSDVSFEIGPGITALLGPNGAGKSTLMRMLTGTLLPSKGRVEVLGTDPRTNASVRSEIGLVPQQDALFDHLSAAAMLRSIANLAQIKRPSAAAQAVLEIVQLDYKDKRPVSQYSKGQRQRVKIASALIHKPQVLMADEPLAGLDPVQRRGIIALLRQLGEEGMTVLLASHVLEEVARFGSDIIIIHQGRLAAAGDFHSLRAKMDNRPHRSVVLTDKPRQLAAALMGINGVVGVTLQASGDDAPPALAVDVNDSEIFSQQIAPLARQADATLRSISLTDDDLESVFRYLVESR